MTVERKVIRLDEDKVVVIRRVPMTGDTADKLREIREWYQKKYYEEHGVDVDLPYPVVLAWIIDGKFAQLKESEEI